MIKRIEPGQQYTRLTVKAKIGKKGNNVVWLCSCICGQETEVRADNLRSGKIVSCGCYRLSIASACQYERYFFAHLQMSLYLSYSHYGMKLEISRKINPHPHPRDLAVVPEARSQKIFS